MYKLKLHQNNKEVVTTVDKTKVGDLMICIDRAYDEQYFNDILLHTFKCIVSLSDPKRTWDCNVNLKVKIISKGTVVKLKVK
jgi:hypothetical protein